MPHPELKLLGGCELLLADGTPLRLTSRKSLALLAILAQRPDRPVPREEIATLLWGDRSEEQARASLRQELSVLRRTLIRGGLDVIDTSKDSVLLDTRTLRLDTRRVAELCQRDTPAAAEELAALYHGEFLAGLDIRSEAFEEWRRLCREQLRDQVLERLHTALVDFPARPEIARTLLRIDETNEEAHRALMRHFWHSGRRGEALQQFQRCQDALRRELDAEPDADTLDLYAEIRDTPGRAAAQPQTADTPVSERRELTVAVIGLASMAELDRDPEAILALLTRFAELCRTRIHELGGKVIDQADGRMISLFGHPRADEADPTRAVSAALDLLGTGFTDASGRRLALRAGIAMGETLVNQRDEDRGPLSVAGPAVMTASRLELQAAPGEVRISGSMRRALRDRFRTVPVRGDAGIEPPQIVLGEARNADRFFISGGSHLTRLTGRGPEMEQLEAQWRAAIGGATQVAVLRGEAGIGKSRLLASFKQRALADDPRILQFHAAPHQRQSALYPLVQYLQEMLGFAGLPSAGERLNTLRFWLSTRPGVDARQVEQVLVALLGLTPTEGDAPIDQDALTTAIISLLRAAVAEGRPVLLIVEDLHWLDPTSQLLLARMANEITTLPLMMLGSSRQPPGVAVPAPSAMRNIPLYPLETAQARALVEDICPRGWPPARIDEIIARADGIPLYLEELVRTAAEGSEGAIPDNLGASLTARIDRLDGARQVLQQAAVIGRVFDTGTLSRLSGQPPRALEAALQELQQHDLVYRLDRLDRGAGERYEFKHALVQEQAYQTLLLAERADLHARLGSILAEASVPAPAELIATHFELGGRPLEAISRLETAGRQALRVTAHTEADAHFQRAAELARSLPERDGAEALELKFLLLRGQQQLALHGFAAPEVAQTYARALTLADRALDRAGLAQVYWSLWSFYVVRAEIAPAQRIARSLLTLCEQSEDVAGTVAGHYALGVTQYHGGALRSAQHSLETALSHHSTGLHTEEIERFGLDLSVAVRSCLGWLQALRGEIHDAQGITATAIAASEAVADVFSMTLAHVFAGVMQNFLRRPGPALHHAKIASGLATRHGYAQWQAQAEVVAGYARHLQGEAGAATQIEAGISAYLRTGAGLALTYARAWLAEAHLRNARPDSARAVLTEAIQSTRDTGVHYFDSELQRLLAQCGGDAAAMRQKALHTALHSARQSGAALLALRAATDLMRGPGGNDGAAALRACLDAFPHGVHCADLETAERLAAALQPSAPMRSQPL